MKEIDFWFSIGSTYTFLSVIRISAFSNDGIIEAIESCKHYYCVGVQWHPEFLIDKRDIRIFKSFINSAKKTIE